MADSDAAKGGAKVRLDDIVARVFPDPTSAQGATLLTGFVGKGDAEGRIRIYPDIGFSCWYDVAEEDVLHSVPLSQETSPLGGSRLWVKAGADVKTGPAAQPQQLGGGGAVPFAAKPGGAAPTPPFSIQPTCGIACTLVPPVCPQPTMSGQTCPNGDCTFFGTCGPQCPPPPCTVPSTLCPTVDVQTCPPFCAQAHAGAAAIVPTDQGITCPRNICTETIPPTRFGTTCPRNICTETIVPTRFGTTCPRFICTETIPPTVHVTCPPHICTETIPPAAAAGVHAQALQPTPTATFFHTCGAQCGVAQPTPTATFFHTCGVQCPSGVLTIVCTQACHQGWTVAQPGWTVHQGWTVAQGWTLAQAAAQPTPTATFNPTQCTRCFICPPVTAPTRTGVFDPLA
ncbi:MAG: hypothetical protein JO036_04050 [Candidatus Eremiobacteraeota bacterium]|nr:hypothetical protein [Candidatus Eremiobacteraeota bacterium]